MVTLSAALLTSFLLESRPLAALRSLRKFSTAFFMVFSSPGWGVARRSSVPCGDRGFTVTLYLTEPSTWQWTVKITSARWQQLNSVVQRRGQKRNEWFWVGCQTAGLSIHKFSSWTSSKCRGESQSGYNWYNCSIWLSLHPGFRPDLTGWTARGPKVESLAVRLSGWSMKLEVHRNDLKTFNFMLIAWISWLIWINQCLQFSITQSWIKNFHHSSFMGNVECPQRMNPRGLMYSPTTWRSSLRSHLVIIVLFVVLQELNGTGPVHSFVVPCVIRVSHQVIQAYEAGELFRACYYLSKEETEYAWGDVVWDKHQHSHGYDCFSAICQVKKWKLSHNSEPETARSPFQIPA